MSSPVVDLAAQPVKNLNRYPAVDRVSGLNRWSTNVGVEIAVASRDATKTRIGSNTPASAKFTNLASTTQAGVNLQIWDGTPSAMVPVTPGQTYTYSVYMAASSSIPGSAVIRWRAADITQVSQSGGLVTNLSTEFGRRAVTAVAPAGAAYAHLSLSFNNIPPGESAWGIDAMLVLGTDPGGFYDGETPGWRWLGTAGSSESIGYPYSLEAIAGRPAGSVIPASPAASVGPPSALSARTIYCVFDITATTDSWGSPLWVGASTPADGSLRIQTGAPGAVDLGSRVDTLNGTANGSGGTTGSGARTIGRHIAMLQVNEGMTLARNTYDSVPMTAGSTILPGGGIPGNLMQLSTAGNVIGVYGFQYFAFHNEATARKIMGWLARQYGVAVPLDDVAGAAPLADLTAPGAVTLGQAVSTEPMTMYLVGNRLTDTAAWTDAHGVNVLSSGISTRGTGFIIQQSGASPLQWQYRLDTAGASLTGYNQAQVTSTSLGVHVYAARLNNGITARTSFLDGAQQATTSATTNSGVEVYELRMQAASSSFSPLRLVLFRAEHDNQTVARVSAWLARKYGAPIPAGY